jgi:cytochrome bd ubiquinol oxidase subunit I
MIKLTTLVLLLVAFFLVMTVYIAPQQGAFTPMTGINYSSLNTVKPQFEEELPIQTVGLGRQGRSIFMAIPLLGHIQLANLALGGSWILLVTEFLFYRSKKKRYDLLARSMAFFSVILFSVGGTMGGAALLFTYSLYPAFTLNVFHIYWWPLLATLFLWGAQIFFLWLYFYTWRSMKTSRHLFIVLGYAIASFFQALVIQMMGSGMLTPNNTDIVWGYTGLFTMDLRTLFSWWFNPTLWALQLHRLAAAIAFFGFLITVLAMFHYQDKKDNPNAQKYWDWAGSYGLAWGLAGLAVQPLLGTFYMKQIAANSNTAFQLVMNGPRAWELLWTVALISALVMTSVMYFIDRRETILNKNENRRIGGLLWAMLAVAAISAFFLVNPGWLGATFRFDPTAWTNPLGKMAYKYVALALLSVVSAVVVVVDVVILGDAKEEDWGNLPSSARISGILAGILGMLVIMVMGFVRESARNPWLVWNIIPVPGGTAYPTPISLWSIFIIWVGLLALFLAIFWYVSKVTAEQPPKSGEGEESDMKRPPKAKALQ